MVRQWVNARIVALPIPEAILPGHHVLGVKPIAAMNCVISKGSSAVTAMSSINDDISICSLCGYIILDKEEGWSADGAGYLYCSESGNIHIPKTDAEYEKSKFNGVLAEILYRFSLDCVENDEYSDDSQIWAGLFLDFHAILLIDSQGFVTASQFYSEDETQAAWNMFVA